MNAESIEQTNGQSSLPGQSGQPVQHWQHWQLERADDGLGWLTLDCAGAAANTLSQAVLGELDQVLDALQVAPVRALVIRSGKSAGFIAGANIDEFSALDSSAAVRALVERGWQLFERIQRLPYPTLALIRGHCLGGGLELALACRYRLAVDEPATRLALPEVMLGIVPAWGGMKRLPALIGAPAALDLMLTGKSVDARRARRLGLVDDAVPWRVADDAARILLAQGRKPERGLLARLGRWRTRALNRVLNGALRQQVANKARAQTAAKVARKHYPAPYAIIDIWSRHGGNALAVPASDPAALEHLLETPTTRNLLRVFALQERLKSFAKGLDFRPRHVHVVGAGVMGGDIAAVCALRGLRVSLQDQSMERIAPAMARAAELFARRLRGDPRAQRAALDRLMPDPAGDGVAQADVIIEAIFEDLDAKRSLLAGLEQRARGDALLASNTSSLRLEDIATALQQPARLVGIHFFNPVPQLPLVEVVRGEQTDPLLARQALGFVRALDKLPLPVNSAPGFLVNAVLAPYMLEALRCVEEGVAPADIDAALVDFGMAIGPVELVDTVGLDIALAAGRTLSAAGSSVPAQLETLVAAGKLGRKSGEGYYRWQQGKAVKPAAARSGSTAPAEGGAAASQTDSAEALARRILAPLYQAADACVAAAVVADADLADAGLIFGAGFPPWSGGPLHHHRQSLLPELSSVHENPPSDE